MCGSQELTSLGKGLLVSVLVSYRSIKRVKAHDFYRIGAGRDEATTPQTTWSGSSVSSPGAAAAGCLESEGSTRAPRAQGVAVSLNAYRRAAAHDAVDGAVPLRPAVVAAIED